MFLEKLIQKLKNEPEYKFSSSLSFREIILIMRQRTIQVTRGLFLLPFIKSDGIVFVGKRTKLSFKYKLKFGKNVIIDDNVHINAFSKNGVVFGNNVTITRDSILICTGGVRSKGVGIKIGDNTGINARAFIGGQGGVEIGDYVIIGPDVKIFSENHIFNKLDTPIKYQGETRKGVKIGNNCWIGAGVTILDGVTLGDGCVVAAGAVVSKSFGGNNILGGIPAKIIGDRSK